MRNQSTLNKLARLVVLALLPLTIFSAPQIAAQENSTFKPYQRLVLLIISNDPSVSGTSDVYSWSPGDSKLFRETYTGYKHDLIMSPDGTRVVYLSLPEPLIKARKRGENPTYGGGPSPTDIWLMDLTKPLDDPERHIHVADQVTGLPTDSDGTDMQRRSLPVWSPDSTQFAWLELDRIRTAFSGRLMIYDIRTNSAQVASRDVSLGYADAGEWSIPDLMGWGSIVAYTSTNAGVYPTQPNGGFGQVLFGYDASGHRASIPVSYFNNFEDRLTDARWLLHNKEWRLGLHYPNVGWVVMDTTNKTYERLENPPFIAAATKVGWTGHLVSTEPPQIEWRDSEGTLSNAVPGDHFYLTMEGTYVWTYDFTPEGMPIWIDKDGQISTVEQDNVVAVPVPINDKMRVSSVVWMPAIWITDGKGTTIEPSIAP